MPFMLLDAKDIVVTPQVALGLYEPGIVAALRKLVRPGQVVLEGGANQGFHTLTLAALVHPNRGRVLSFEPDSRAYAFLQMNVAANGLGHTVKTFPCAVHRQSGPVAFYATEGSSAGSNLFALGASEKTTIEAVRVGDVLREEGLRPDLVRLDVEGAEPLALEGMWEHLESTPHIKVLFEFFPRLIEHGGQSPEGFLQRLGAIGMHFWKVEDDGALVPTAVAEMLRPTVSGWADYVAARSLPGDVVSRRAA
jgi:FkbM family methyltransferase